jgi:glycosyltransferase involved in cell wall biosynthesis
VVIIPSYNNNTWYKQNLDSLLSQTYDHWHAIYIDDNSSDGTGDAVQAYLEQHTKNNAITLIKNSKRLGALSNIYTAIMQCPDDAIIVTLDGDDWFAHPRVLERINQIYQDSHVWMTYGSYQIYPDKLIGGWQPIPKKVIETNNFRNAPWYSTHLRTFYAWLFKRIQREDLMHEGLFLQVTWDMAFMFPMLEMAGEHSMHVPELLYIYNQSNPINDYKVRLPLVLATEKMIRGKTKYYPLC